MRPLLLTALLLPAASALAGETISLHCVGKMTEDYTSISSGTKLKTTSVQGERFYEISDVQVIEHIGDLTMTTTKVKAEESIRSDSRRHSGTYQITPLVIRVVDWETSDPNDDEKRDSVYRSFSIDRQTAHWEVTEWYSGPWEDFLVQGRFHVKKSLSADGACEPWDRSPKF